MRDLVVLIKPNAPSGPILKDPLIGMKAVINGHDLGDFLDGNMLRNVIPAHRYDFVGRNDDLVYFLPFDNTPAGDACTGRLLVNTKSDDVSLLKDDTLKLVLVLEPGEYDVHVMARRVDLLTYASGMGNLAQFSSPSSALDVLRRRAAVAQQGRPPPPRIRKN